MYLLLYRFLKVIAVTLVFIYRLFITFTIILEKCTYKEYEVKDEKEDFGTACRNASPHLVASTDTTISG